MIRARDSQRRGPPTTISLDRFSTKSSRAIFFVLERWVPLYLLVQSYLSTNVGYHFTCFVCKPYTLCTFFPRVPASSMCHEYPFTSLCPYIPFVALHSMCPYALQHTSLYQICPRTFCGITPHFVHIPYSSWYLICPHALRTIVPKSYIHLCHGVPSLYVCSPCAIFVPSGIKQTTAVDPFILL